LSMSVRPSSFAALVLCAACALGGSWSKTALADDAADPAAVEEARKHFAQGLKLYKDGDHDAALLQFERAYSIKPNYKVLYNIAQCHFELHQYVEARDKLSEYLKEGEGNIEPERKSSVQNDLNELERRIGHLVLNVNANGATVYVDGKKVGVTPLARPLDVNEGQRTLSIETPDRGVKQRVVQLAGGDTQTVVIDFDTGSAEKQAAGRRPLTAPPQHEKPGLGTGFWVTGIGALALGAGAGVTGYLALRAKHDREDDLKRFGVSQSELDDSRSRAKTFALTTDILAGSAVVWAGIAGVLFLTHDSGSSQVGIGVGPGSVNARGRF